jgi:hypothetical protein
MSKRDTFIRNILTLTACRTADRAMEGWSVHHLIDKPPGDPAVICELCGTRFYNGAVMVYPAKKATISVGGDCVRSILTKSFPDRGHQRISTTDLYRRIGTHYRDIVDPGNWIKWVVENAPQRLANQAAMLQYFERLEEDDLTKLIRFHDNTRKYPRHALIPDCEAFAHVVAIPKYLTIAQYKKLQRIMAAKSGVEKVIRWRAADYRETVKSEIKPDEDLWKAWRNLTPKGKRCLTALCKLSDADANSDSALCSNKLAENWSRVVWNSPKTAFVWSRTLGVGLVVDEDWEGNNHAFVWLWREDKFGDNKYDLSYWREITTDSESALVELEKLAFG